MDKITFDVTIKKLGYPGSESDLLFLPKFEKDPRTDHDRLYDKRNRKFEIKAVLNKSSVLLHDINFYFDRKEGSSFISVDPKLSYVKIDYKDGSYKLFKNDANELSTIEFECICTSTDQALSIFYEAIMPLLDHLSYSFNVPIFVEKILGNDIINDTVFGMLKVPYPQKVLHQYENRLPNEMKPIFALYREAKNSGSNYYKFLCYYKILEGIYKHVRPQIFKIARKNSTTISTRKELVPEHEEIIESHKKYIGKSIHTVYKNYLRQEFRNAIAHFLSDDEEPFIVSDYRTNIKISSNITFIEICCRAVISNQLFYSKQLQKK